MAGVINFITGLKVIKYNKELAIVCIKMGHHSPPQGCMHAQLDNLAPGSKMCEAASTFIKDCRENTRISFTYLLSYRVEYFFIHSFAKL